MPSSGDAYAYITSNVGVEITPPVGNAVHYVTSNVGVEIVPPSRDAVHYVTENVDSTIIPTPHVWDVLPDHGKPGSGIKVVGTGFGTTQFWMNGKVSLDVGGTPVEMPVVSWSLVPGTADATGPGRVIDLATGDIDPQHGEVVFRVPYAVDPGTYDLTVSTNIS
jgi:hypothetical protein